jgi:hypothetical protein
MIDPYAHNVSSAAPRDAEPHATCRSGVSHPDSVVPNNTDSTIETIPADLPDKSSLSSAKPPEAAMPSRQNNLAKHDVDREKVSLS